MDTILRVIWLLAATTGAAAVLVALARPRLRRSALAAAAAAFVVAGILGILSIGILFLLAAVGCGVLAMKASSDDREGPVAG